MRVAITKRGGPVFRPFSILLDVETDVEATRLASLFSRYSTGHPDFWTVSDKIEEALRSQ